MACKGRKHAAIRSALPSIAGHVDIVVADAAADQTDIGNCAEAPVENAAETDLDTAAVRAGSIAVGVGKRDHIDGPSLQQVGADVQKN